MVLKRIPRGFQGISKIFDSYIRVKNKRLAEILNYNPKRNLVGMALNVLVGEFVKNEEHWLFLESAEKIVSKLLPGREYDHSLYFGLVKEGIVIEDVVRFQDNHDQEIVRVAYERFADHLIAKTLLDTYLDIDDPPSVFSEGKPLAFFADPQKYVQPGVLEAMCIQVPERIGQEFVSIAPEVLNRWEIRDAFLTSVIWRNITAFSDDTFDLLNRISSNIDTIDALITIATLPDHPFNAKFLDRVLRKDSMSERDTWWSTNLHRLWGKHTAVNRLIDWASGVTPQTSIDDEVVGLCATTMAWMLTTSNRYLRDRATKSLVSLLTGRLKATKHLIEQFFDVDDPYVTERVYAVAYGVVMRSNNGSGVGDVADCVYEHVFADDHPPIHLLLRDYARGIVERAICLDSCRDVVVEKIRPPYKSLWPTIPSEDEIKPLLPDWLHGSYDSGDVEWARNTIGFSVMQGDFAHYVIGTNSHSTNWLNLKLNEPGWKPPKSPDEFLLELISGFSIDEKNAWDTFEKSKKAWEQNIDLYLANLPDRDLYSNDLLKRLTETSDPKLKILENERQETLTVLEEILTEDHLQRLTDIFSAQNSYHERHPPYLDLAQIQRYILWRVFDLGWTTERFGDFDRFWVDSGGRDVVKAERIGKKYQWIAYHEIMALVSDHFQYREKYREEDGDQAYIGPWQDNFRNIDPSITIRSKRGGTSWYGHSPGWWDPVNYNNWGDHEDSKKWIEDNDDFPNLNSLLSVTNPRDGTQWINLQGHFNWQQEVPPDKESTDVEKRELWYIVKGYLMRAQDTDSYLKWAENVDFVGDWMPDPIQTYHMFLGENGWSPASQYFKQEYIHDFKGEWTQPGNDCPIKVLPAVCKYICEEGGFDCSIDASVRLYLPTSSLISGLGLRWTGNDADYVMIKAILWHLIPLRAQKGLIPF